MNIKQYLKDTQTTQADFGSMLGVTQGLVYQWISGKTKVTATRAIQIERATGGAINRAELLPDIFGEEAA